MSDFPPTTDKTPGEAAPQNVKIYERPERSGPSPLVIALIALAILIVAFVIYKAFVH